MQATKLTVSTVDTIVGDALGAVAAVCIVGDHDPDTSEVLRTWRQTAARSHGLAAAYISCTPLQWRDMVAVETDHGAWELPLEEYPLFALRGMDIVVLDSPHLHARLVAALLRAVSREPGVNQFRLLVLAQCPPRQVKRLPIDPKRLWFCNAQGRAL